MGCHGSHTKTDNANKQKLKTDNQFNQKQKEELSNITSKINIHTVYKIQKNPIGSGGFGFVKIGTLRTDPNMKSAIKFIEKKLISNKMYMLLREIQILQKLDHPNIVKIYETYEDNKYFYICQEYCDGGELLERITKQGYFSENQAAFIIQRIASAVSHMHAKQIVHRDIKLENILYATREANSELKLIDFGLSNKLSVGELHTQVGTPIYVSPQVIRGSYDEKCDIWSIGVLMYILLCGYPPFYGPNKKIIYELIEMGKFDFKGKEWNIISKEAKDLISNLLVHDPKKRFSAKQILQHKWLKDQLSSKSKENQYLLMEAINHARKFRNPSKFKNEVMNVFVNQLNESDIKDLNEVFRKLDKDGHGLISLEDLKEGLKTVGMKLDNQEIDRIFQQLAEDNQLDTNGEKNIKYTGFIKASLNRKVFMKEEKLWNLFKYFDHDDTNTITYDNLQEIFRRHGKQFDDQELKKMILEVDSKKDGKITFEQFKKIMLEDEEQIIQQSFSEQASQRN